MPKLRTFSLTLEWGQRDEGHYYWAGQAKDYSEAKRLAREEMDCSYNEQYCKPAFPGSDEMRRGKEAGKKTTAYVVSDWVEGVNEFAAAAMLAALKHILKTYGLDEEDQRLVQDAITKGEGRD